MTNDARSRNKAVYMLSSIEAFVAHLSPFGLERLANFSVISTNLRYNKILCLIQALLLGLVSLHKSILLQAH